MPALLPECPITNADALCQVLRGMLSEALQEGGQRLVDAATQDFRTLIGDYLGTEAVFVSPSQSSIGAELIIGFNKNKNITTRRHLNLHRLRKTLQDKILVDIGALQEDYACGETARGLWKFQVETTEKGLAVNRRKRSLPMDLLRIRELQLQAMLRFVMGTMGLLGTRRPSASSCIRTPLPPSLLKDVHHFLAYLQLRQTFALGAEGMRGFRQAGGDPLLHPNKGTPHNAPVGRGVSMETPDQDRRAEKACPHASDYCMGDMGGGAQEGLEQDVDGEEACPHGMQATRVLDSNFHEFLAAAFLKPFRASHPQDILALYTSLECEELLSADFLAEAAAGAAAATTRSVAKGVSPKPKGPVFRCLRRDKAAASGFVSAYNKRREAPVDGTKAAATMPVGPAKSMISGQARSRPPPPPPSSPSGSSVLQQAMRESLRPRPSHYLSRINSFHKPNQLSRRPLHSRQQQQHSVPTVPGCARPVSVLSRELRLNSMRLEPFQPQAPAPSIIRRGPVGRFCPKRQREPSQEGEGSRTRDRTGQEGESRGISLDGDFGRAEKRGRQGEETFGGIGPPSARDVGIASPVAGRKSLHRAGGGITVVQGATGSDILGTPPPSRKMRRPGGGTGAGREEGSVVVGTPELEGPGRRRVRPEGRLAESPVA